MPISAPSITDIKLLFARSGNRCAFPKCKAPMALGDTLIGEVCHIKGARPGSARHDPAQLPTDRHLRENLILMCPTHHTVIDDDEASYTVERIRQIKYDHEGSASPVPDDEVVRVAISLQQNVSTAGQTGGPRLGQLREIGKGDGYGTSATCVAEVWSDHRSCRQTDFAMPVRMRSALISNRFFSPRWGMKLPWIAGGTGI